MSFFFFSIALCLSLSALRTETTCRCLYNPWHEAHSGPSANLKWKSGWRKQPRCLLTAEWISVVFMHQGRLLGLGKGGNSDAHHNVDVPGECHAEWNQPVAKRRILFDSTNMNLLESWSWWIGVKIVAGDRKREELVFSELGFQSQRSHLQNNVNVVNSSELDT